MVYHCCCGSVQTNSSETDTAIFSSNENRNKKKQVQLAREKHFCSLVVLSTFWVRKLSVFSTPKKPPTSPSRVRVQSRQRNFSSFIIISLLCAVLLSKTKQPTSRMNHRKVSSARQISSIIAFLLYLLSASCRLEWERAKGESLEWFWQPAREPHQGGEGSEWKWGKMHKERKNPLMLRSFTFVRTPLCLQRGKIKIQAEEKMETNEIFNSLNSGSCSEFKCFPLIF